jgi:hypothetical protein
MANAENANPQNWNSILWLPKKESHYFAPGTNKAGSYHSMQCMNCQDIASSASKIRLEFSMYLMDLRRNPK